MRGTGGITNCSNGKLLASLLEDSGENVELSSEAEQKRNLILTSSKMIRKKQVCSPLYPLKYLCVCVDIDADVGIDRLEITDLERLQKPEMHPPLGSPAL